MPALISIAVPIYNTARFLPAALDSLLEQDHLNWEGLLWDDGSSDGSGEIAADYARRDARFHVLGNGRNNGLGCALAFAMDAAQGEYLGELDADDMLEHDALSSMLAFMQARPELGMGYSQYCEMNTDGDITGLGSHFRTPYSAHHLLVNLMTFHFRLFRADAYRAVGGFDREQAMSHAPDYDLCLRMSEHYPIEHLAKSVYRYRVHAESMSQGSRLRQVKATFAAATRALERRGLQKQYALSLGVRARHVLRPKQQDADA